MRLLGVISAATTLTRDNTTTAVPFTIPANLKRIGIECETPAVFFNFVATGGAALAPGAARRVNTAHEWIEFDLFPSTAEKILALHNPTGGTVVMKVFALL